MAARTRSEYTISLGSNKRFSKEMRSVSQLVSVKSIVQLDQSVCCPQLVDKFITPVCIETTETVCHMLYNYNYAVIHLLLVNESFFFSFPPRCSVIVV